MLHQPRFSDLQSENYLQVGTEFNIKSMLELQDDHRFLFNATNYNPEDLTKSLVKCLIANGGKEFLKSYFQKNTYLAMRFTSNKSKQLLAKAIEKFLDYSQNLNLRLILFYLYFYIKVGAIDVETLKVATSEYVLGFNIWKESLTEDEVFQLQVPDELWEGIDLIGKQIKSPDKEKKGRLRNRAISLFNVENNTQSDDTI